MYHRVGSPVSRGLAPYSIEQDAFHAHLDHLTDGGYRVVTVSRAASMLAGREPCPSRVVALSFDDASEDFLDAVVPALVGRGFEATVFVPTGFVGRKASWMAAEGGGDVSILGWSGLAEVIAAGMECGSHTVSHPQLDRLAGSDAVEECRRSKLDLQERLGVPVWAFAYPYGYWSSPSRDAVDAAGYTVACGVGERCASSSDHPLSLPRLSVLAGTDVVALAAMLRERPSSYARHRSDLKRIAWRGTARAEGLVRRPWGA